MQANLTRKRRWVPSAACRSSPKARRSARELWVGAKPAVIAAFSAGVASRVSSTFPWRFRCRKPYRVAMESRRSLGNRGARSAPPIYVALVLLIVCLLDLPVLSGAKTLKACHDNDFCNRCANARLLFLCLVFFSRPLSALNPSLPLQQPLPPTIHGAVLS